MTSSPLYTADADSLVEELVDEGAVAIELENELFRFLKDDLLSLTVYLPPAVGEEIVKSYGSVQLNGTTYDFDCTFTMDVHAFGFRHPVYANENLREPAPVSPEEGLANHRDYVTQPEDFRGTSVASQSD